MLELGLVFMVGVLGSAHCVGMCGGFVIALSAQRSGGSVAVFQALYFAGKTTTYALFGAVAGGLGAAAGMALAEAQGVLSLALGAALVVVGLSLCGALRRLGFADRIGRRFSGARWLAVAAGRLVARGSGAATFGLGMLNGLLPCALVYGLLARAAAEGAPLGGAAVMAAFGLGTVPALALTGAFGRFVPPARRLTLSRVGGVLVVLLGLMTFARGVYAFAPHEGEAGVMCLPGTHSHDVMSES